MPPRSRSSRKQETYERILDAAARAIREVGFSQVSVADIMQSAGLTHGGFYAHFSSREAMLAKALERAGATTSEFLTAQVLARSRQGIDPFQALVEAYLSERHLANPGPGCPVAALSSEMSHQSDSVREAARGTVRALVNTVSQFLPAGHDPEAAVLVVGTMVGALQLARALGNNQQGKALLAANRKALLHQYAKTAAPSDRR